MNTVHELGPRPKKRTIVIGIVIVLIVALSVVAVVLLSRPHATDTGFHDGQFTRSTYPGGLRFTIGPVSTKTQWGDMKVLLQNGSTIDVWSLTTAGLTGAAGKALNGSAQVIGGGKSVYLNVTDKAGNGYVNGGDYITLEPDTAFSAASSYTLTLLYVPTGSEMAHWSFTG